jgi:hypothetical protein
MKRQMKPVSKREGGKINGRDGLVRTPLVPKLHWGTEAGARLSLA